MATIAPVRPSPLAGKWYEGNPNALARAVDHYLDQAELPELPGQVIAIIAPHAGHIYSGPVAGYAFSAVRGSSPDLVAVLSPMHQASSDPLLTTAHAAYSTPLGQIQVEEKTVTELDSHLKETLGYGLTRVAYDQEHSLEIEQLGAALAETVRGRNCLLVASTDLSHFYSQNEALAFDTEMLRRIESFSPQDVFYAEVESKGFACGLGALTAVLWAAKALGADTVKVLHHATSGDVTGDYSSVVGYGAAVILKTR